MSPIGQVVMAAAVNQDVRLAVLYKGCYTRFVGPRPGSPEPWLRTRRAAASGRSTSGLMPAADRSPPRRTTSGRAQMDRGGRKAAPVTS